MKKELCLNKKRELCLADKKREETKRLVLKLLKSYDINIAAASKMLNISEQEVHQALEELELE